MKKRLLALLLCSVMVFASVPAAPFADLFTIEASAEDRGVLIDRLEQLVNRVSEMNFEDYIDTSSLEDNYAYAMEALDNIENFTDSQIQTRIDRLQNAINNLKLHTQAVSFKESSYSANVGAEFYVDVILEPADAADEVKLFTDDEDALTVYSNGRIKVNEYREEPVKINALSNGKAATCTVKIGNLLDSVSLSKNKASIYEENTVSLEASSKGKDPDYAPSEKVTYTWKSSDSTIATVDGNGVVRGNNNGTATITVTAKGEVSGIEKTASAEIEVKEFTLVTKLTPSTNSTVNLIEKATRRLSVTVSPDNASIKELYWTSSAPDVVKIIPDPSVSGSEAYANIEALKPGKATINYAAMDGTNIKGSFTVEVKPQITKLTMEAPNKVLTPETKGERLICKIEPSNAGNQVLEWTSSNDNVCKVDNSGYLNPIGIGRCIITAKATDGSGKQAQCLVIVSELTSSISLNKNTLTLNTGDESSLVVTVKPFEGDSYNVAGWSSSNERVATVDQNGKVTAKGPGTTVITATALDGSGKKASCNVTVRQPVESVSLPASEFCSKGGTLTLRPTFSPTNVSNRNVTWTSSDPTVATVDAYGTVKGIKVGTAVITVKTEDGNKTAACTVSVEIMPTGVTVNKSELTLYVDSAPTTFTLAATVLPADATNKGVKWSSNSSAATVDENTGMVTAVHGGTAIITAKTVRGGKTATCKVTVIELPKGVKITNIPDIIYIGKDFTLSANISPATASNKAVTWKVESLNGKDVITLIDAKNGQFKAIGEGFAKVTVTTQAGNVTNSHIIEVTEKVKVTGLALSPSTLSLKKNSGYSLLASISPSNASEKGITWTSSDNSVAKVDANGRVTTFNKVGNAVITATTKDGGFRKTCAVTVIQPVTGVNLSKTSLTINKGQTATLTATVLPSDASNKGITWASSNTNVLTVSQNGVITAKNAGSATVTVTAKDGGLVATCNVKVNIAVTGIKFNYSSISVPKGESRFASTTISPSDATNRDLTWSSADPSIATVNDAGQITGKRTGTTTVTVKTKNGGFKATCTVKVIQLADSVKLDFSSVTLDAGKKKTLKASVKPSTATDKTVKWKSSNKTVATISSKGVITAVSAGTATISATSADGNASVTCKVTVTQPATGIKFSSKSVTVKIGTPKTLKPTIKPSDATNKSVTYKSSDSKIAKVSSAGVVTGIKKGTAKITATTANGLYSATITVNVQKPVKSVKLNKTSVTIGTGKKTALTPTISPASASNKKVSWKSSNNDVLTVDSKGVITAKEPGYAVITCTTNDGKKTATCSVRVVKLVTSVKLNKKTISLESGDKLTLKANVKPSNASDKSLKWSSSDKKVAKVSSKGVVTAVSTGVATITVKTIDGGFTAACKVYVVKKVDSVSVKSSMTLYLGETEKLKATVKPSDATDKTVTWKSSDKKIATVSSKGVVTAKKPGKVKITVTTKDGSFKDTCTVTVARAIEKLKINKTKLTLDNGKSYTLKITKTPSNATETINWTTSNKKVATVSSKGVIKAVGKGTATITGKTGNGIKVTCKVTVKQPVTSMQISHTSAVLYIGDKLTLKANVLPSNANNKKFTWSVSAGGNVSLANGVVTAKKVGTATVTVKSENGKTAKCVITVKQHVTGITLDKSALSLTKGSSYTLKATIQPSNASEKGYTFTSSNAAVASVDANGKVTAKAPGKATVTVRSKENNKTATCVVTVIENVTGVSLNTKAQTIFAGEAYTLKATVTPATASNKAVKWSSSNSAVATVDANGKITAKAPGTATITVTTVDGAKKASCTVTVLRKATGISISETEITVVKGNYYDLTATVLPSDAHNKNVTWSVENPEIATVDNGRVTAVEVGETTVTVTSVDGGFTAKCTVTVTKPVTDITLDKESITLYRGTAEDITETIAPEDAGNKNVKWTSSDEQVATVDENGTVTAIGKGQAVITATTVDGGFTASCNVTVIIAVESITTDREEYYVPQGSEERIIATVLPEDAENKEIEWSSDGDEYFTLTDGVIQANETGSGYVTITSKGHPEITKTVAVHVTKAVKGVELDEASKEINKGESFTLTATVLPEDAHNKKVSWTSSNEQVATVDENGTVTAVGKGEAVITVTTEEGEKTAECIVTVKQLVEEITFEADEYTIGTEEQLTLIPSVLPENANNRTLTWESDNEDVAKVDENGIVTAIACGEAIITAKANDESETETTVKITVVQYAEELSINEDAPVLWVGENAQLTATILPDNTTDKSVSWESSDENIATVDENGKVTAISAGEATITATSACRNASDEITVEVRQQVTEIRLSSDTRKINADDSFTLTAEVLPENAFDKALKWETDKEDVATVDENGLVTAIATGTAIITATSSDGEVKAECTVIVTRVPTGITLSESSIRIEKATEYQLSAELFPEDVTETKITWSSSDEDVITVTDDGLVTAVGAGQATVRAQTEAEDVYAECTVTVYVNSEAVNLNFYEYVLYCEDTVQLEAALLPEDTTNKNVLWSSSDNGIATVDGNGLVTAVECGEVTITATTEDTGVTAECKITVKKHAQSITLDKTEGSIFTCETFDITATVLPDDATDKSVIWTSSDENIATVENGKVKGVSKGTVTITAKTTDGEHTAECTVEVRQQVTGISLSKTELTLPEGKSETITATALPEAANNKNIIWVSSDDSIATVDGGEITAVSKGTATITATAEDTGDVIATCTVTVTRPVSGISFAEDEYTVSLGSTLTLTVNINPSDATNQQLIWSSSDELAATVDQNGVVTPKRTGTTIITVESVDGGYKDICVVEIVEQSAE